VKKKPNRADVFDVGGQPPISLTRTLSAEQTNVLRRYVGSVTDQAYRIAYDCGFIEGLAKISLAASVEMKRQRERMLKSEARSR
jgi:hypothetical protein